MANFLLVVSGEEEGKVPTFPSSEVLEACKYVFIECIECREVHTVNVLKTMT